MKTLKTLALLCVLAAGLMATPNTAKAAGSIRFSLNNRFDRFDKFDRFDDFRRNDFRFRNLRFGERKVVFIDGRPFFVLVNARGVVVVERFRGIGF